MHEENERCQQAVTASWSSREDQLNQCRDEKQRLQSDHRDLMEQYHDLNVSLTDSSSIWYSPHVIEDQMVILTAGPFMISRAATIEPLTAFFMIGCLMIIMSICTILQDHHFWHMMRRVELQGFSSLDFEFSRGILRLCTLLVSDWWHVRFWRKLDISIHDSCDVDFRYNVVLHHLYIAHDDILRTFRIKTKQSYGWRQTWKSWRVHCKGSVNNIEQNI